MLKRPLQADANLILRGLVFAWVMNSARVLAGNDGLTAVTKGALAMLASGSNVADKIELEIAVGRKA
jgi:hypothetical protein